MTFIDDLICRNETFIRDGFSADLKLIPAAKTILVGCLDPRVDPLDILGLRPGEVAIIRNIGGRVNPALMETLTLLPVVSKAAGQDMGVGWNLVILHHTQCGIVGCYKQAPGLLAKHLGVSNSDLDTMAIADPYAAVAMDVAAYRANTNIPSGFIITGLVYDVATGKIDVVIPPSQLRQAE